MSDSGTATQSIRKALEDRLGGANKSVDLYKGIFISIFILTTLIWVLLCTGFSNIVHNKCYDSDTINTGLLCQNVSGMIMSISLILFAFTCTGNKDTVLENYGLTLQAGVIFLILLTVVNGVSMFIFMARISTIKRQLEYVVQEYNYGGDTSPVGDAQNTYSSASGEEVKITNRKIDLSSVAGEYSGNADWDVLSIPITDEDSKYKVSNDSKEYSGKTLEKRLACYPARKYTKGYVEDLISSGASGLYTALIGSEEDVYNKLDGNDIILPVNEDGYLERSGIYMMFIVATILAGITIIIPMIGIKGLRDKASELKDKVVGSTDTVQNSMTPPSAENSTTNDTKMTSDVAKPEMTSDVANPEMTSNTDHTKMTSADANSEMATDTNSVEKTVDVLTNFAVSLMPSI